MSFTGAEVALNSRSWIAQESVQMDPAHTDGVQVQLVGQLDAQPVQAHVCLAGGVAGRGLDLLPAAKVIYYLSFLSGTMPHRQKYFCLYPTL